MQRRAGRRSKPRRSVEKPARLIELFLDMLAAERGAAANTLAAYRRDLSDFAAALAGRGGSLTTASNEQVRAYLQTLSRRGLVAASVARRLSAIRQLFNPCLRLIETHLRSALS